MTYEYECTACGHKWEAEQTISEPALEFCADCGDKTAKRLISGGTGFALHGEGWGNMGYAKSSIPKS